MLDFGEWNGRGKNDGKDTSYEASAIIQGRLWQPEPGWSKEKWSDSREKGREGKGDESVNKETQVSGLDIGINGGVINGNEIQSRTRLEKDEFYFALVSLRCIFSRYFSIASDTNPFKLE